MKRLFRNVINPFMYRFSKAKKPVVSQTFQSTGRTEQVTEQIATKQLEKYLKEEKDNNEKIKHAHHGHLDFYLYMGVLSSPLLISGIASIGLILTNPTSTLLPWLHYAYTNLGCMTMLGYCGIDMASLAVWNILNPDTVEYQSNRLRILLYAGQMIGSLGLLSSGLLTGPEIDLLLVEALVLNMITDLSCKEANAVWYESRKAMVMGGFALMFILHFSLTSNHREALQVKQPMTIDELTLKLNDYR